MATKNKKNNPAARAAILGLAVGIPILFVLAVKGTKYLSSAAPFAVVLLIVAAATVYTGMTTQLLYRYFESTAPWYAWLPCFGELAIMDSKFMKVGAPCYLGALIFLLISRMPYSVVSFLGEGLAINLPFIATVCAFVCLAAVQVVKGFGILHCIKVIGAEWESHIKTSLGLIKSLSLLGFIPFVRVMAVYALNKPLSTLVTFRGITTSDSDDVVLSEE